MLIFVNKLSKYFFRRFDLKVFIQKKIIFVNSQHKNPNSKGDIVLKTCFKRRLKDF